MRHLYVSGTPVPALADACKLAAGTEYMINVMRNKICFIILYPYKYYLYYTTEG